MIDFTLKKKGVRVKRGIKLEVESGGKAQEWVYSDITAGLVLEPCPYYTILGELAPDKNDAPTDIRGPFYLLAEGEDRTRSFEDFYHRMTDDFYQLDVKRIYFDDPIIKKKELADHFYSWIDKVGLKHLGLVRSPFCDDFPSLMRSLLDCINNRLIQIPKNTLCFDDLEKFHERDLDAESEKSFYRLRALAFNICGFLKFYQRPLLDMGSDDRRFGERGWQL